MKSVSCKKCGQEGNDTLEKCVRCGENLKSDSLAERLKQYRRNAIEAQKKPWTKKRMIFTVVAIVVTLFSGFFSNDNKSVEKQNQAVDDFNAGLYDSAIQKLEQAKNETTVKANKIELLKTLGYAYETSGKEVEALATFKEALDLTRENSFDYHLLSGEVSFAEKNFDAAYEQYVKAYELEPKNFQINNTLTVFYLDFEEVAPKYKNYQKALFHAQKAHEYDLEKNGNTKINLALAYYFNGSYDEAVRLFSEVRYPENRPYVFYFLGLSYLQKQDYENGKIFLQKAMDNGIELPSELKELVAFTETEN